MSAQRRQAIIANAKAALADYGLDWSLYDEGQLTADEDEILFEVVFTHKHSQALDPVRGVRVRVTSIFADDDGNLMQFGDNYGDLVL